MTTRSSTKSTSDSASASKKAKTAAKPASKASSTKSSTKSSSKSPSKPSSRTTTALKSKRTIESGDDADEDAGSDGGMQDIDEEAEFVPMSYKEFSMTAKPVKVVFGAGGHPVAEMTANVKQMKTESFGWTANKKVKILIGDVTRDVTVSKQTARVDAKITVNMVLNNSNPGKSDAALAKSIEKRSASRSVSPVKKGERYNPAQLPRGQSGTAKAAAKKRKAEEESETDRDEDENEGSDEE